MAYDEWLARFPTNSPLRLDPAAVDATTNDDELYWCSTSNTTTYTWWNSGASKTLLRASSPSTKPRCHRSQHRVERTAHRPRSGAGGARRHQSLLAGRASPTVTGVSAARRVDAVLFDAGGVLVTPDPAQTAIALA